MLAEDQLTTDDWAALNAYYELLKPFKEIYNLLQGTPGTSSFTSIGSVLPSMEYLLEHLEQHHQTAMAFPDGSYFRLNIDAGWQKLNNYYTMLENTPAYVAAVVLNPRYRWEWIETVWAARPEWVVNAKRQVQELWESEYKHLPVSTSPEEVLDEGENVVEPPPKRIKRDGGFDDWLLHLHVARPRSRVDDEYSHWIQSPLDKNLDQLELPINYWNAHRTRYPRLSRMATDLLSVPAMSSEVERVFSLAGQMDGPLKIANGGRDYHYRTLFKVLVKGRANHA